MECLRENFEKDRILDGRFRTVAPLNHGSFGMVFLATDMTTGQDVAIKCLTKTASVDSSAPFPMDDQFEELEAHRRLGHHPNLVNLIHSFETDSHMYLVLEYCANGDLYEAIRHDRGPLETEHVRDLMLQLVSAIEFMHANGLYHRDIKPENIFLMTDGSMKLGDFGLATRESWCHEACVGSDRYMAPEQYEPTSAGYSPAQADIWSLGICLLNILFSRNPFTAPTGSDVLYSDYVRDRQSLFDIFPNMSQDTFEILTHALAIDPAKRSLSEVRDSILRTVSFTTDESLDEFCTEDREVVTASANREPLRTPSIQSPHINQGDSFPWTKMLQSSPATASRQLSVIPDNESYTEDLFPPSEVAGTSWFSAHPDTPSMASVLDSAMGDSFRSFNHLKTRGPLLPRSDPVPITGSLPSHATKPLPSLSMVFGKNSNSDQISKSWSDLWEEEESENEDLALQQRHEQNSRSWSQESRDSPRSSLSELRELDSALPSDAIPSENQLSAPRAIHPKSLEVDSDTGTSSSTPRPLHQASPKNSNLDKWAKLGDKRRNCKTREPFGPSRAPHNWRRDWGLGSSGFDHGARPKRDSPQPDRRRRLFMEKDWRRDNVEAFKPSPAKFPLHYDSSLDDDLEIVGGWHDLHL
jgi:serine/threonine protein kinase